MTQNLSVGFWIKMENTLHIISQVVCTLFQHSGAKLLAYGDSLRTGVEKGLLHNSNAISHFCFIYQYINRFCFILIMYLLSFIFVQKPTGRSTIYARFFAAFSSARLTDEVPESVCFIIMDSKMSSRGNCRRSSGGIPGYIESWWQDICEAVGKCHGRTLATEHRKGAGLSITALDKKENMWVRTQWVRQKKNTTILT